MQWIALALLACLLFSGCATTGEVAGYAEHSPAAGPRAGIRVAAEW